MKTLVIVSRNKKKKKELKELLNSVKIEVLSLDDIDINVPEIVEDGKTFRQNAIKKAVTISKIINAFVIADDSGLEVDYLDGKPGVRSSRFARAKATDQENNRKLIRLIKDIPEKMRGATFVCTIALADNGELIKCVQGTCKGRIGFESRGYNGFGYDPLFTPDGYKLTFAEMKSNFKNRISHRARALEKAKKVIQKYL
jgi:XTP/dITP diphosphohydrolase